MFLPVQVSCVSVVRAEWCRASSGSLSHTGRQVKSLQPDPPPPVISDSTPFTSEVTFLDAAVQVNHVGGWVTFHDRLKYVFAFFSSWLHINILHKHAVPVGGY